MRNEFLKKEQKVLLLILIFFFILSPGIAKGDIVGDISRTIGEWLGWLNPLQVIANILALIASLLYRLAVFIFALLGFIFSLIGVYLGWAVVPAITNALIKISLNMDVYNAINGVWESVRTFSLQLVEIFLLIIGLLTIFRIREYEARKTLVWLIIAALLVSFSLNIGKKLIEWGNKFTTYVANYFFGISGDNYFPDFSIVYSTLANRLWEYFGKIWEFFTKDGDLHKFFTVYLWVFALDSLSYWIFAILSFYISFVLLALGIVFLLRMVYLICLLVVSPIAFLTAGLRTKEIKQIFGGFLNWDGWWPAFLEWVFIGMVLIIWLGVGVKIYENFPKPSSFTLLDCSKVFSVQAPEIQQSCEEQGAIISELFPWSLPVLALAVAIHIGVKTSPGIIKQAVGGIIGAVSLIGAAITTGLVAAATAGAGAFSAARAAGASRWRALGSSIWKGATEGAKTFGGRMAAGFPGVMGKALPEEFPAAYEAYKALIKAPAEEVAKRAPWVKREVTAPLISGKEEAEKAVEEIYKEKGVRGVLEIAENPLATREMRRAAVLKAMREGFDKGEEWAKDETMRGLMLQIYTEAAGKGDKKTMSLMERRLVRSLAEDAELQRSFREVGIKYGIYKKEEFEKLTEEEKRRKYLEEILKGVKTADDIKQLQKGWYKNVELLSTAIEREYLKGPLLAAMSEDREFVEIYSGTIRDIIERIGIDEFVRKYPRQAMYLAGSPAQELGYTAPPGLTRERIRELKRRWEEEEERRRRGEERPPYIW